MIGMTSFFNIGCADHSPNIGFSDLETQVSDIPLSGEEAFGMENSGTEMATNDILEGDVSVGDVHLFEREDKISTMFYDLQLDRVTFTDSVGGVTAESGREFMTLDVTIAAYGDEKVISMYAQEFLMVCFWGDFVKADSEEDYEKLYPLEEELAEGQLGNVWLAVEGEDIKGKLIYNIPKDAVRMVLLVYDSYTTGDLKNEVVFGDGYMITIPEENWDRIE
ncbi:MAG: hypothetical protein K2N90_07425 [Lachnospiraceae bacterium]|nr:hypothetical protein [Lachnospiraceae bacterium]